MASTINASNGVVSGLISTGDNSGALALQTNNGTTALTLDTSQNATFAGNVTLNAQGDLRLADSDSSNYVALQAPATVASNVTFTMPGADGTSGQVLQTNGSGTLSFATPSSGSYVLVGAYTNSGSATLDIEDVWSTYSNYILVGTNFYMNSGSSYMQVRLKISGSYQEGTSYVYINGYCQSSEDDVFRTQRDAGGSRFIIYTGSGQTSTNPTNFTINLPNPSSSLKKELYWTSIVSASGTMIPNFGGGQLGTPTSAITGVRFFDSGANGFYGTVYVYGLKNS